MSVSAAGSWEMLVCRRDSTKLQLILPPSTYSSVLQFCVEALVLCPWGMQVPGEKAVTGLSLRAGAWLGACMGTLGPVDLKVTLVVIAIGLWQGF